MKDSKAFWDESAEKYISGATAICHAPHVKHVVGTDISDKMIEAAKKRAIEAGVTNITFQQGTLDNLTFKNENFDAVLGLNVLHLLEDVDDAIIEIYRLLKRNGVFISSTSLIGEINFAFRWLISAMQFFGLAPYVNRFTKSQLISKLLTSGFVIEREWQVSYESVFIVARKI
ncbi:class I SAM-dependent methyltransferase [Pseudomonas sp. HK3]